MTRKIIVAFSGYARSGKDTAGAYLVERFGFKRTAFADPLKQMVQIAFGFSADQLWGPSDMRNAPDARYPFSGTCVACGAACLAIDEHSYECVRCRATYPRFVSPRIALQTLGTEWGRRLTPDLWADATLRLIEESDHERWVITDMRFPNEREAIRVVGGHAIRLTRGERQSDHVSETALDGATFDHTINNLGTIECLYREIDQYMLARVLR